MTLKVYVGWDPREIDAFDVCRHSLIENSSIEVEVIPLQDWKLRAAGIYWRPFCVDDKGQRWDDRDGKPFGSDFSFTRFCVPILEAGNDDWVVFCDPDFLWQGDIADLMDLVDPEKALMCVKHDYVPKETTKAIGIQSLYARKNWSSLMLINPLRNVALTKYNVNNRSGSWLHGMLWLQDHEIGALPEEWNWLEGWSDVSINPQVIHYTRGTPDMAGYEDVAYADFWWDALSRSKASGVRGGRR